MCSYHRQVLIARSSPEGEVSGFTHTQTHTHTHTRTHTHLAVLFAQLDTSFLHAQDLLAITITCAGTQRVRHHSLLYSLSIFSSVSFLCLSLTNHQINILSWLPRILFSHSGFKSDIFADTENISSHKSQCLEILFVSANNSSKSQQATCRNCHKMILWLQLTLNVHGSVYCSEWWDREHLRNAPGVKRLKLYEQYLWHTVHYQRI